MRALKLVPHCWFARAGTTIDSVAVAREAKPDMDPSTNWTSLGIIASLGIGQDSAVIDVDKGQPGKVMPYDKISDRLAMTYTGELIELSELAVELIYGTAAAVATTFQPGHRGALVQGWLHVQAYDELDAEILNFDVYGAIQATGGALKQRGIFGAQFEFMQLYSSLNTGNLSNL